LDEEIWLGTRYGVCYGSYEAIYDRAMKDK